MTPIIGYFYKDLCMLFPVDNGNHILDSHNHRLLRYLRQIAKEELFYTIVLFASIVAFVGYNKKNKTAGIAPFTKQYTYVIY